MVTIIPCHLKLYKRLFLSFYFNLKMLASDVVFETKPIDELKDEDFEVEQPDEENDLKEELEFLKKDTVETTVSRTRGKVIDWSKVNQQEMDEDDDDEDDKYSEEEEEEEE